MGAPRKSAKSLFEALGMAGPGTSYKEPATVVYGVGLDPGLPDRDKRRRSKKVRSKGQSRVAGEVLPEPAARARDRVIPKSKSTSPKLNRKTTKLIGNHAPMRLAEFPAQSFKIDAGQLFCQACQMQIGDKKSLVRQHILGKVAKDLARGPSRHQVAPLLIALTLVSGR